MDCPNCGGVLIGGNVDSRQEWDWCYYHCPRCQKDFLRTTTRRTQSELVESDELEEIKGRENN